MNKFTPGPWEVELMDDRTGDWFSIKAPMVGRTGTVADTYNWDHVIEADEDRANAYLMAAGPALFGSLVDLLEAVDSIVENTVELDPPPFKASLLDKARAAIAKAIGEAT